ncbi:MAG: MFS transporter [Planctomycetaceae bacterium]|nr:MFS transporter [Planctomycetaceae bacterium]
MNRSYYRWELLALLSCAFFFHQADRAIFGVLLTSINADLKLSDDQLGFAASALFFTIALMVPIAGYAADRFSKKWIITASIIFWSIATAMTGLARGITGIVLFRSVATAGGESFYAPAAYPLLAAYHKTTRSLAMAVHQGALYVGLMVSGYLAAWINGWVGWRGTFFLFGAGGVLLGLLFIFRLRDIPKQDEMVTAVENPSTGVSVLEMLKHFFMNPTALLLTVGFSAIVFVNNAYVVWAPAFIEVKFSVSQTTAAGGVMLYHHFTAFCGILLGGVLTDRLIRRFPRFRMFLQSSVMLCGAPAIYYFGCGSTILTAWIATATFGLFRGLYETNTHAAMFDVVKPEYRGSTVGLMTMSAFLLGSLSPILMGRLSSIYGKADGLSYGFAVLSIAYIVGAVAVLLAAVWTFRRNRVVESI